MGLMALLSGHCCPILPCFPCCAMSQAICALQSIYIFPLQGQQKSRLSVQFLWVHRLDFYGTTPIQLKSLWAMLDHLPWGQGLVLWRCFASRSCCLPFLAEYLSLRRFPLFCNWDHIACGAKRFFEWPLCTIILNSLAGRNRRSLSALRLSRSF